MNIFGVIPLSQTPENDKSHFKVTTEVGFMNKNVGVLNRNQAAFKFTEMLMINKHNTKLCLL